MPAFAKKVFFVVRGGANRGQFKMHDLHKIKQRSSAPDVKGVFLFYACQ